MLAGLGRGAHFLIALNARDEYETDIAMIKIPNLFRRKIVAVQYARMSIR